MAHDPMPKYPKYEPLVYGIELEGKNESKSKGFYPVDCVINLDYKQPLAKFLNSVFHNGGKVLLVFPDSGYAQVKDHAHHIRNTITRHPIKHSIKQQDCDGSNSADDPSWYYNLDVKAEIVAVLVRTVPQCKEIIKQIFSDHKLNADISVVKLINYHTSNEALTVETEGHNPTGEVYFKNFTPDNQELDDTSLFFRVEFGLHNSELVVLWINLKTLLPISVSSHNDVLYAVLPQATLVTPNYMVTTPPNVTEPFYWLSRMLNNQSVQGAYFKQHGVDERMVIYLANDDPMKKRVSKGDAAEAMIKKSNMEFTMKRIHVEEPVNSL